MIDMVLDIIVDVVNTDSVHIKKAVQKSWAVLAVVSKHSCGYIFACKFARCRPFCVVVVLLIFSTKYTNFCL